MNIIGREFPAWDTFQKCDKYTQSVNNLLLLTFKCIVSSSYHFLDGKIVGKVDLVY